MKHLLFFLTILATSAIYSSHEYDANSQTHFSWIHPRLVIKSSPLKNYGLFAADTILHNELLVIFGGKIMTKDDVLQLPEQLRPNVLQISDHHWIGTGSPTLEPADFINHSCNPNAGIKGQIHLVAMRDIQADEEITFDFATVIAEWVGMDAIACNCGSSYCRKIITQDDWKNPCLQEKYKNYFSTYLQEKIDREE
jgi:uncharacterized protein